MYRRLVPAFFLPLLFVSLVFGQADSPVKKNRVIFMGMIHSNHVGSEKFGLDKVRDLIRDIKPDAVFCEIPPDRIDEANRQYKESGKITESRVKVFPEYVDVLYPLTKEMDFKMYPCAGWTKPMADARRKKMKELSETHADEYAEMTAAQKKLEEAVEAKGGRDNPEFIHTDEYDALVKKGLEPYDKHFNDALGAGGWTNINKAHYGLVEKNLDKLTGQGQTILIMFGAWHKSWFMDPLRLRDDIELINLNEFLSKSDNAAGSGKSSAGQGSD